MHIERLEQQSRTHDSVVKVQRYRLGTRVFKQVDYPTCYI